jgi:hypothetical protein
MLIKGEGAGAVVVGLAGTRIVPVVLPVISSSSDPEADFLRAVFPCVGVGAVGDIGGSGRGGEGGKSGAAFASAWSVEET